MKCKEHRSYVPRRLPTKTAKYPDGCPTCLGIWEHAKVDKGRLAAAIEIPLEEARIMIHSLEQAIRLAGAVTVVIRPSAKSPHASVDQRLSQLLKPIYVTLVKSYRDAQ